MPFILKKNCGSYVKLKISNIRDKSNIRGQKFNIRSNLRAN